MNTQVYKPFKRNQKNWKVETSKVKDNGSGRKLLLVNIGVQQIVNADTNQVINTTPVTEYVYQDILVKIFTDPEEYAVRVNLGCTPQLIITCENRLVLHNDEISDEIEKIRDAIKDKDIKDVSSILVNSELNYNTKDKLSSEYRKLIDEINEKCEAFYPPDFIGLILREYFFEQKRNLSDYREEIHYMGEVELKEEIGKALSEENTEKLETIKEELLYAYLLGDIVTNPKVNL